MSDRLTLAHAIEDAGIERAKAERLASVIFDAIHDNVATESDVQLVRADLQVLRSDAQADVQLVRADLQVLRSDAQADVQLVRADVQLLRTELQSTESRLKGEIALVEHRLLTRLGGMVVVAVGIILAAIRYLPAH
jgi:hypothetical protein